MSDALLLKIMLGLLIPVSALQLFSFPAFGTYLSFALLLSLLLLPFAFGRVQVFLFLPFLCLLGMLITHAVSMLWSSDLRLGIKTMLDLLMFMSVFAASYTLTMKEPRVIPVFFKAWIFAAIIPAALIVLFRVSPGLEHQFLTSSFAGYFINPNTLISLFGDEPNNVLDPQKAGGFFVNANAAAAYFGIGALISFGYWLAYRDRGFLWGAGVFLLTIWFTGSKAGIVLSTVFPLAASLFYYYTRFRFTWVTLSSLIIVLFIGFLAFVLFFFAMMHTDFGARSLGALGTRMAIWSHMFEQLRLYPLTGLGFGGWELNSPDLSGTGRAFPPHNMFIMLWSSSGVIAVLIGILFFGFIFSFGWRGMRTGHEEVRGISLGISFAFLWVLVQGMGENWGIVGEAHMLPLLASTLGFCYARRKQYAANPGSDFMQSDYSRKSRNGGLINA